MTSAELNFAVNHFFLFSAKPVGDEGDNDLETMRLTLPPTAMSAIIAAQNEQR